MLQAEDSGASAPGTYGGYCSSWPADIPPELRWNAARLENARETSWKLHGKKIRFYLPGMYVRDGVQGEYPALSITGARCRQQCAHCGGKLLLNMPDVGTPERLRQKCRELAARGVQGVLLSGGCDGQGQVPWAGFADAIAAVKQETGLFISLHCGMIDGPTAKRLRTAGVDQALLDIIGSEETYASVYHLPDGPRLLRKSLDALDDAGLPVVPHIVAGLHFGRFAGENRALELLAQRPPELLVIVAYMNLAGTVMESVRPPDARGVCGLVIRARELMPQSQISLGCARPRAGSSALEILCLRAGVNRMALPSHEAAALAARMGLQAEFRKTCCSVLLGNGAAGWSA